MGLEIFVIFFAVILILLVLMITFPIYKNHFKTTKNTFNYNSTMRQFVYKVAMSKDEILNTLQIKNDIDELSCTFDFDRAAVRFSEYGTSREYYFDIQECEGFSIVRLNQVSLFAMGSHVPYKLNPFFIRKLNAETVPFSLYGVRK